MSEYQLCHVRIPFKLYEKIKKISVKNKVRLNAVFAEVLTRGFENKVDKKTVSSKKNK